VGHQVARGDAAGLLDLLVVDHAGDPARNPGLPVRQRLLGQQVGLGDTPITFPSSSMTGKPLTRYCRSVAAISLKVALRLTATI